jgi:rod shape determining protein RodA
VAKQPDLGTALLILFGGLYVIFFAGLSWRLVLPVLALGAAGIVALVVAEPTICNPACAGPCCATTSSTACARCSTPRKDPLGKGFHIIQGMIAIGSGGLYRQGLHERHADAPGVHPRAHHRLHLRRLLRGIRPGRRGCCCAASCS